MANRGNNGAAKKRTNGRPEARPHEEYLELAAISTAGDLTDAEQAKLRDHLTICADCRQALQEFEAVANMAAPVLASELTEAPSPPRSLSLAQSTSVQEPKDSVSATAASEQGPPFESDSKTVPISQRNGLHLTQVNCNLAWIPFPASILLPPALVIYPY